VSRQGVQDLRAEPRRLTAILVGAALAGLKRVAQTRPARAVLTRPRVERVASVLLQSTAVRGSARFVARELSGRGALAQYELRSSGRPIYLRHNTADLNVLGEVFYSHHYDLPDPVAKFLGSLGRPPEIVDLGANIGMFGVLMLDRFPGARITALEPDRSNAEIHRRSMAEDDAAGNWQLIEAAASNRDGRVSFRSGEYSRSRIEVASANEEVDAVDIFPYLNGADFAKIDIEGGEWPILGDERFAALRTPVLVLEYHSDLCPLDDPRAAAFAAVMEAGYRTMATWEFPGQGMLWAWKPDVEAAEARPERATPRGSAA
jgi:FkbM family methyltransferase